MNPSWLDIQNTVSQQKRWFKQSLSKKEKEKKIVQTVNKNNYYDGGPFGEGRTNQNFRTI